MKVEELAQKYEDNEFLFDTDDSIWEESTPNSLTEYSIQKSSSKNVLVLNKGKVKDNKAFKEEFLNILTDKNVELTMKISPKKRTTSKLHISSFKNFRTENVAKLKSKTGGLLNQSHGFEAIINKSTKPWFMRSKKRQTTDLTPRWVSRKMSSSKILRMLKENDN